MAQRLSSAEMVTRFIDERISRETAAQQALRAETRKLSGAGMMSRPEADALLQLLIKLVGAKRVIEVGTFTGSGSLAMALALPEEGRIVTCDVNAEWTAIGESARQSGLSSAAALGAGSAPARWTARRGRTTWPSSMPTRPATTPITKAA